MPRASCLVSVCVFCVVKWRWCDNDGEEDSGGAGDDEDSGGAGDDDDVWL